MTSALADAATFVQDPEVLAPLGVAIVDHAKQVLAEDPSVESHPQRASLAMQAMYDTTAFAKRFIWAVATDEDLVAAWIADDKDTALDRLDEVVSDVWNACAGVTRY